MDFIRNRVARNFWFCFFLVLVDGALVIHQSNYEFSTEINQELLEPLIHLDFVNEFSVGKLYYRTLYLDIMRDTLYVGAMDNVFMLNSTNINQTSHEGTKLDLTPRKIADCLHAIGSEDLDCHNHIKVIQPMKNGDILYICGTNGLLPKNWMIYRNLTHLPNSKFLPKYKILSKCSASLHDSTTTVWVGNDDNGNRPGLYTARTTAGSASIFRTRFDSMKSLEGGFDEISSPEYDYNWLENPNFVGSFEIGPHVYFFFSEVTQEDQNQNEVVTYEEMNLESTGGYRLDKRVDEYKKVIYSRVARVCKKDIGYKSPRYWTDYTRARLNCSIPSGTTPFYFNEIQSIYKVPGDDTRFYGVFTIVHDKSVASAICSFHIDAIQEVFRGRSKIPVLIGDVTLPDRPPKEDYCSKGIFPSGVNQIHKFDLVSELVVSQENGRPVFHQDNNEMLTKLIVDKIRVDSFGPNHEFSDFTVYYAGSNDGKVYTVVQWIDDKKQSQSNLIDVSVVTPDEPIRAMEISKIHQTLYVASDNRIIQTPLAMCSSRYNNCQRCVRDPHCGWDKDSKTCKSHQPGLLQDASITLARVCDVSVGKQNLTVPLNWQLFMKCFVGKLGAIEYTMFRWYRYDGNNKRIRMGGGYSVPDFHFLNNLTDVTFISGMREEDAGEYECWFGNVLMASYKITIGVDLTSNAKVPRDCYEMEQSKEHFEPVTDEPQCTGMCQVLDSLANMAFIS